MRKEIERSGGEIVSQESGRKHHLVTAVFGGRFVDFGLPYGERDEAHTRWIVRNKLKEERAKWDK